MKKFKSKAFFIFSIIFHILLSLILLVLSWQLLEPNAYDNMVKTFSASKYGNDNTVLIVIDDKSTATYRWPWKRELYAEIFGYLNKYTNPKVIGYDAILITLDNENPESDKKLFKTLKPLENLVVGFSLITESQATKEITEKYEKDFYNKFGIKISDKRKIKYKTKYTNFSMFPKEYFNAVNHSGCINTTQNPSNGTLTFSDLIVQINGNYYPTLALRMYMLQNNADELTIYDNYVLVNKTGLKIPTIVQVPLNGIQSMTKYYKLKHNTSFSHIKYSAIDIMESFRSLEKGEEPLIDPKEFEGKTVFVGANATASAVKVIDELKTPLLIAHPGVDFQATVYDNINDNEFMKLSSLWFDLTVITLLAIITFAVISKLSFFKSILILVSLAIGYLIFSAICYYFNFGVNVVTPLIIQLVTMIFAYSYNFIMEGKNKEKIKNVMGRYISQDVMKNIVKNIDDVKLGGKRANVTVLFADIRGFTSMSEKMSAEEVSVILNEYFTEIEPIISKYNGTINKFIGDAVMAIFGDPIPDLNHPLNAVKCANAMLKKVEMLQDKWILEGKPKIEIGIGINTGDAFVGNIGSEKRLEYTVIGDTVNLASRIESYNKVYRTNFLISSSTYSSVSSIADVIKISEVQIRGKAKKMDIYEVLRISEND